jgi:hypothetical protein
VANAGGITQEQEDAIKNVREEWKPLIRETIEAKRKITIANVVDIWKLPGGKIINGVTIVWLENGNLKSGVVHILHKHKDEFLQKGINLETSPKRRQQWVFEFAIKGMAIGDQ